MVIKENANQFIIMKKGKKLRNSTHYQKYISLSKKNI